MLREAKIDEDAKTLTIVMDLQEPTPSASGKTLVVATTHGNQPTDVMVKGKPVTIGVNAVPTPTIFASVNLKLAKPQQLTLLLEERLTRVVTSGFPGGIRIISRSFTTRSITLR